VDGLEQALPLSLSDNVRAPGSGVVVGIRPEHFHPLPAQAPGALPIQVDLTEPTGADTFVAGRLGTQKVTLRCSPKEPLRPGETGWFGIDSAALTVFDPATELRLDGAGAARA
jgi:multiple sugar transport system ATP-binding protein